jgi:hypothetical protein
LAVNRLFYAHGRQKQGWGLPLDYKPKRIWILAWQGSILCDAQGEKYIMSSAGPKDAWSSSRNHLLFPMCFVKCKTAIKHDGTICTVQIDLNQRVNSFDYFCHGSHSDSLIQPWEICFPEFHPSSLLFLSFQDGVHFMS